MAKRKRSSQSDRCSVLAAVQSDWETFKDAPENFRGDREIVLAAVKQNGCAIEFAAETCRGD
eukprot:2973893-Amphidinium_carterae.1